MLNTPIESLPNTSVLTIRRLKSIGVATYWDLLNYFPFRYEDRSVVSPIFSLQEGDVVITRTVTATSNTQTTTQGNSLFPVGGGRSTGGGGLRGGGGAMPH